MELLISIAYFFLVRLVFFDYKLLRFNLFWKFVVFGIWIGALLTEVLALGQFAPYSKSAFVQTYVVQMAPEWGGRVENVYAKPNVPIRKGDPLFQMDPTDKQYKVDQYVAALAAADTEVAELAQRLARADAELRKVEADLEIEKVMYEQIAAAAGQGAASRYRLESVGQKVASLEAEAVAARASQQAAQLALDSNVDNMPTAVASVLAELNQARYELANTTVVAPTDGYVSNLQIHPGSYIRLKTPIMSFISTEEHWIVAKTLQNGVQRLAPGDKAEVAFAMYPGKVFDAEVVSVVWANGNAQGIPSGVLPPEQQVHPGMEFFVRLRMTENDPKYPLRFGARAIVAMYSEDCADFLKLLRQIEIQSESFLNYLFNPF
ncbi:Inner membrane protein YibH [Halioglobus japonicus]|nr:Inner membrane protein YibH [Halioglobus japonicus]